MILELFQDLKKTAKDYCAFVPAADARTLAGFINYIALLKHVDYVVTESELLESRDDSEKGGD